MDLRSVSVPGDFPRVVQGMLQRFFQSLLQDDVQPWLEETVSSAATAAELRMNEELKLVSKGETFNSLLVVEASADTVTLLFERSDIDVAYPVFDTFPPRMESASGLKIDLLRAAIEIKRHVNFTKPNSSLVEVVDLKEFTLEVSLKRTPYLFRIGGGMDKLLHMEQYLVGVDLTEVGVRFRGYLAKGPGGFIIWVHSKLPHPIPLGTTNLALQGLGLEYGERFAPRLSSGVPADPIEEMRKASAIDYVNWATSSELKKWVPVSQDLRIIGITADIGDAITGGNLLVARSAGIAYLSWGPTLVMQGFLRFLDTEIATVLGAIDFESRSMDLHASTHIVVFEDWLEYEGSVALSASLEDESRTWMAVGGFDMDGCAMAIVKDGFVLRGGFRVIPSQGAAVRGRGQIRAKADFLGLEGGYSFFIAIAGSIGWNPAELGGQLDVGGSVWIKFWGVRLGVAVMSSLSLQVPKPRQLKLAVEFTFELPWPMSDIHIPVTVLDYEDTEVSKPQPGLALAADAAIGYFHACSGTQGKLGTTVENVWPDVSFELPFLHKATGAPNIVNRESTDGFAREAGITTTNVFTELTIYRIDEATGNYELVQGVNASWLGLKRASGCARSSRLAIPSNEPLAWQQRFDYSRPSTAQPLEEEWLQTFGAGPDLQIALPPSGPAYFEAEDLCITSSNGLRLHRVPWGEPYPRVVFCLNPTINVSRENEGVRWNLPVLRYDIRLIASSTPRLRADGLAAVVSLVRELDGNFSEWSAVFERQPADRFAPLRLEGSENDICIAAVGYVLSAVEEYKGGSQSTLQPGLYKLRVEGFTVAHYGSRSARTDWASVNRLFRVIQPPKLRPYIRYATFGDERAFEVQYGGWNPNPSGFGFGHYLGHRGVIRFWVSYLSQIYPSLWIELGDGSPQVEVHAVACSDGSTAGGLLGAEWSSLSGGVTQPEQEIVFDLPRTPGQYLLKIYRDDASARVQIDEWPYRVSAYEGPLEHLQPANALTGAWGPFGHSSLSIKATAALPGGFDFDTVPPAQLLAGWALPSWLQAQEGISHVDGSLAFLRLMHWAGVLDAPPAFPPRGVLQPASGPSVEMLLDSGSAPLGFLLRAAEPVDWRRIKVTVTHGSATPATDRRFGVRLLPSPDGCSACALMLAEAVLVRAPIGFYAVRVSFQHRLGVLPALMNGPNPSMVASIFTYTFEQPIGRSWNV